MAGSDGVRLREQIACRLGSTSTAWRGVRLANLHARTSRRWRTGLWVSFQKAAPCVASGTIRDAYLAASSVVTADMPGKFTGVMQGQ